MASPVKPSNIEPETAKTDIEDPVSESLNTDNSTSQSELPDTDGPSESLSYDIFLEDRLEEHLQPEELSEFKEKLLKSRSTLPYSLRVLLLSDLPMYSDDGYTEEDVAKLLSPLKFQLPDERIKNFYVVPQACMAFARMSGFKMMRDLVCKAFQWNPPRLRGRKLRLRMTSMPMSTFGFYKTLLSLQDIETTDDGSRTVYIENITAQEFNDLKEVLKNIGCVKHHLQLLNKVFIEFESILDVDRFGVWHSLLKRGRRYRIYRVKPSNNQARALQPKVFLKGFPDVKAIPTGAVIPPTIPNIPDRSFGPFWVPMNTYPFVFSTSSVWFNVPEHLTISKKKDLSYLQYNPDKGPTVMLTGFPARAYHIEDIAKVVGPHVTPLDRQFLYYNLTVLPLQNRAFIHFRRWAEAWRFLRQHLKFGVYIQTFKLTVHVVQEDMHPGFTEVAMYRNLMRWSNSIVPSLQNLEERLLCVEISELTLGLVTGFMKVLASVVPFVGFLPLANRLCIEMAEPSGVTLVVQMFDSSQLKLPPYIVDKVQSIKTVKSFRESFEVDMDQQCEATPGPPELLWRRACQSPSAPPLVQRPATTGSEPELGRGPATLQEARRKLGKENRPKITVQK